MKKETIFVDRYKEKNVNDLLGEIFWLMSNYSRNYGDIPKEVKMTAKQYYKIREHKEDLIKEKDKEYYILCMKVVL